jgi:hypothetical protein
MITNGVLVRMWKETVVVCIKVRSQHLSVWTEEDQDIPNQLSRFPCRDSKLRPLE